MTDRTERPIETRWDGTSEWPVMPRGSHAHTTKELPTERSAHLPLLVHIDALADFDGDLTDDLFAFMVDRYWVVTQPDEIADPAQSWILYRSEPMPVPNTRMAWRRPTWAECLAFVTLPRLRPDMVEPARRSLVDNGNLYGCPWRWMESQLIPGRRIPLRLGR